MRRLTARQRAAAIALIGVAACLLTLDLAGSSLRSAHSGVRGALGALYRGTDSVLAPVRAFVQGVPHAGSNEQRLHALQSDNARLRKQVADAEADRKTAAQLHRLHLGASDGGYRILPARVLAIGPAAGFDWTVTLDAGSASGVRVDQTVTDGYGLVGRVLHADPSSSVVLLAVDPGAGVGARDLRSGQVGVCTGTGRGGFTFRPLDPTARLQVGDRLGTGPSRASSFVPGLSIGTVRSVRVSADGTTAATVTPTVSAGGLDVVGVIISGGHAQSRAAVGPSSELAGGR